MKNQDNASNRTLDCYRKTENGSKIHSSRSLERESYESKSTFSIDEPNSVVKQSLIYMELGPLDRLLNYISNKHKIV